MNFENKIKIAIDEQLMREASQIGSSLLHDKKKIYVIGRNDQSSELIKKYNVLGLIDDYNSHELQWNGIPILKTRDIDRSSIIVNCSTSIGPVLVHNNLFKAGFINVISISDLISGDGLQITLPLFVSQQREELQLHKEWWSKLYSLMSDDYSKKVLADVLRFRLSANLKYLNEYSIRIKDQYFEDFMGYKSEIFVDAGGFDGDTTEEFINRYPDYQKVYFFEPSKINLDAARRRLAGRSNIDYKQLGLSDSNGSLFFNGNAGSASAISGDKGEPISVVTLDDVIGGNPVTFIKMDLEGWEMNALRGAEATIRKNKPKLAIAVYHSAKDFREVPMYLLSINPEYKIFLRHYTQGWSETVMYFL